MKKPGLLFGAVCGILAADDAVYRVGPNVSAPRVKKKVDPEYSREARAGHIQGSGLYRVVVLSSGRIGEIEIISPIGYGLDEKGIEAIRKWEFVPAKKKDTGESVNLMAQIEVTFRFVGEPFDSKAEARRTAWNLAVRDLKSTDQVERAVQTVTRLASEKYPKAVYLLGAWKLRGEHVAADPEQGFAMIRDAAAKDDAAAVFEMARFYLKGEHVPIDEPTGLRMLKEASMLGSPDAQRLLGERYRTGADGEVNEERARYYFRLCAAGGFAACQFRMGSLLVKAGHDPVQAAAWLQLAMEGKYAGADEALRAAMAQLDSEQTSQVAKLKVQLTGRSSTAN